MLKLNTILVPTDCSEHSKISLRYAKRLAAEFGASITLLYVDNQPIPKETNTFAIKAESDTNGKVNIELENFLKTLCCSKKEFKLVVLEGEIVSEIINYTKQEVVDLIVMSSHGYKGLAYSMKGSVTEKVTRYANCPVLSIKNGGHHFIN